MHRDIILRTACSEKSDSQSVKLIDSRGRKPNTSKISIYSQKYATALNPPQRQELKVYRTNERKIEDPTGTYPLNSTIRQVIHLDLKREDSQTRTILPQEQPFPATGSFDCSDVRQEKTFIEPALAAAFREHMQSVRLHYEGKIREILEDNARVIGELRGMLVQQQLRLAEKEEQINKIINAQGKPVVRIAPRGQSPQKTRNINAAASNEYLCNKMRDLDINIKLITQQFEDSHNEVAQKMERIEKQLIRRFAEKVGSCWFRLTKFVQKVEQKYNKLQSFLSQLEKQPVKNSINEVYQKVTEEMKQKIIQFSQDIRNFSKKQYKYENEGVQGLQHTLIDLMGKLAAFQSKSSLQGSRRINGNGQFLDDDDEFFYPSSQRKVYENNDDYQHFQSQSDEERHPTLTKENISNNVQYLSHQKIKNH